MEVRSCVWNLLEMEVFTDQLPGKHTKNHGKSPFLMGQLTISMAIFNSYAMLCNKLPEARHVYTFLWV